MNAAELLVACLEREGVDHVFGLPGEELEDLLFALRDSDVTFVPVRHEQGAAFMANVHGRLTGEPGVCLGTLGPGATNLVTGVADANLDKAPLVAITGQGGLERLHQESHQALDVVQMFEPITKWNAQLNDTAIVHESVRKAFKVAAYEKPGATHLEVPEDVAGEPADCEPMVRRDAPRPGGPAPDDVARAAELLEASERPLIIAGNGAVRHDRVPERLRSLVAATAIPVASTYMGKGAVPDSSPRSLMTLGSGDHQEASDAIASADLVMTVGYDIAEHDPADWNTGEDATIVHVDSQPAEVYEAYDPELELICDCARALAALEERVEPSDCAIDETWYRDIREHIVDDVTGVPDDGPFTVAGVLPVLRDVLDDDDVLISDVGSHKMRIAQNYRTEEPNTCIISNGLASMGIAVPGGVAADIATDGEVVAATGDGGFMMNGAEIETATRIGCGFTVLVFNDDDYGLISEKQEAHRGESTGTGLTNPDFVALAESFGIAGHRPSDWDDLEPTLREAVESDGMALVEIPLE